MKTFSTEWIDPAPVTVPPAIETAAGGHRHLAEALVRRGIRTAEQAQAFLDPQKHIPAPATDLPDLAAAADHLERAMAKRERIGVWGDFDVDGQTATTLLVSALRRLGADVIHYIPVRGRESHGIALPSLAAFLERGVQLLLTCDTGVGAHEAVNYARSRQVTTLITDHHTLPAELPPAEAVVNPQRLPLQHPLSGLCGVGCAYKLVEELYRRANRPQDLQQELDLVALGTVADVAPLQGDNRYLVQKGLEVLRAAARPALRRMLQLAEINPDNLSEEHISYVLAPRLNALGRLNDANPIVDFLTGAESPRLERTADQLELLNNRRKLLCDQVFQAAQSQIERDRRLAESPVLVLSHPAWPAGVIGIVASRLVEIYNRPAILIAAPPGEVGRGSARSIPGVNITQVIAASQELLRGYGGHPMAAGLAIDAERIPEFRRQVNRTVSQMLPDLRLVNQIHIDAYLPLEQASLELVETLEKLAPFGPGNPAPLFACKDLLLSQVQIIGRGQEHLLLTLEDAEGRPFSVIWWQAAGMELPEGALDLAYTLRASDYKGQRRVQIECLHLRPSQRPPLQLTRKKAGPELYDLRQAADPPALLAELHSQGELVIWAEGETGINLPSFHRYNLSAAPNLALWSIPPGPAEFQAILLRCQPQRVYLFAQQHGADQPGAFLTHLSGLVQHALKNRGGWLPIPEMAAAANQRQSAIRKGIAWLVHRGHLQILAEKEDQLQVKSGGQADPHAAGQAEAELKAILQETAAYRAFFVRAAPEALLEQARLDAAKIQEREP